MRIRSLRVAGFRGFNAERTIEFSDRLTLVAAPNSHGKTSITESLEFLLFGETSKVAHAPSKEEYRGSYRNSHWPSDQPAYIEAVVRLPDGEDATLRIELDANQSVRRLFNGQLVESWPFEIHIGKPGVPFILQHALKYLLLVPPNERFRGFARLLGLDEVDETQRALVSLCTKPEATISEKARHALRELESLESRMGEVPELQDAVKEISRGATGFRAAFDKVISRIDGLLGPGVPGPERLARLINRRKELAAKVYSGTVRIKPMSGLEGEQFRSDRTTMQSQVSAAFLEDFARLAARGAAERLSKEASLLELGVGLLDEESGRCPLCEQELTTELVDHLKRRHKKMKAAAAKHDLGTTRTRVGEVLRSVRSAAVRHHDRLDEQCRGLLQANEGRNREKVIDLFGKGNEASWSIVKLAAEELQSLRDDFEGAYGNLESTRAACEEAVDAGHEKSEQAEQLARALDSYLVASTGLSNKIDEIQPTLVGPDRILRQAIDSLAGTGEYSLLIELLERQDSVERALRVRDVVVGLKELRRAVEQTVGETMEAAFSADLTTTVMDWYARIRTSGDPDVHFAGFAMDKTRTGDYKKGKVKIRAQSYGVELASAVSSLSESKLNALGLCVSIASALRSEGPWRFLVLDDPIQSWDAEHETRFIEVVRALVEEEQRQVILLTHKDDWAGQVSAGCRTLNGRRYKITGYTQEGPHLSEVDWASVDQRIREADQIARSADASEVKLQQAEEEIRIIICQLVSEIAERRLHRIRSPHNLNGQEVRGILVEAGVPTPLVERVNTTFKTVDDAHHAPKTYSPNAQRIRQYVGTVNKLRRVARSAG